MPISLYVLKDLSLTHKRGFFAHAFGIRPGNLGTAEEFSALTRKISLKKDLKWKEVKNLQKVFSKAGLWSDFPVQGLRFISAELKGGVENQRIDILYLREDGGLYPCELKLGSKEKDSHGQLIRYIADLYYQRTDSEWLMKQRLNYLKKQKSKDEREHKLDLMNLESYLTHKHIAANQIRPVLNSGIIVDEGFKPQMLKAVRYLNDQCGFFIRLLKLSAYVDSDWAINKKEYLMRIDVEEI